MNNKALEEYRYILENNIKGENLDWEKISKTL